MQKASQQNSMNYDSYSRTKLFTKDTTPSFPGICVIRANLSPARETGDFSYSSKTFQKVRDAYSPPLERLIFRRKWATVHNIDATPIQPAGITDTFNFSLLQMVYLTFISGDVNAHSPLWDTN